MQTIRRSYKYRFYPTAVQAKRLAVEFGHARYVWNWALAAKRRSWVERKEGLRSSYGFLITVKVFCNSMVEHVYARIILITQ